jgi:thiol-disulfide isomerase/thioredoxin
VRTLLAFVLLVSAAFAIDPPRSPAPNFRAKSIDGKTFDNASLKGRVVLVQFWTTWCRYCRADQPHVEQLARDYPQERLTVLAVSVGESRKKVKDYLEVSPRQSQVVLNEDTNLPAAFEITGFPSYVVLDAKGQIAAMHEGSAGESVKRLVVKAGLQ